MFLFRQWRLLLIVLLGLGFVLYKPEIIPNDEWRLRVVTAREAINRQSLPEGQNLAETWQSAREKVLGAYSALQKNETIPGLPEEVVVNEYVEVLSEKVKSLPAEQLKQVKQSFCQDVIDEATASGVESK